MKHERPDLPSYAKIRQMNRGSYDKELAYSILDAGMVGHAGFVAGGRPMVIPMIYARTDDTLYLHGASTTRIIKGNPTGAPATFTVTLLDGIVVARSAFHHSMNYRCAIVHGTARQVGDADEKVEAFAAMTDHLLPGRWEECRPMLSKELKATGVLAIEIEHVATKVRNGPPVDDEEDYGLDVWAGVLPIMTGLGQPYDDGRLKDGIDPPASIKAAKKKFG